MEKKSSWQTRSYPGLISPISNGFRHRRFRCHLLFGLVSADLCPGRARWCSSRRPGPRRSHYSSVSWLRSACFSLDIGPSGHCGNLFFQLTFASSWGAGVEMGRVWISDSVLLPGLAWNLRLACRVGRYGDRLTAPLVLSALLRRPGFAASKSFVAWNLSGILDLTVAVSIGALVPLLAPNLSRKLLQRAPMAQLPLVLVPTYLVPTFLILHLTALFQARRLGR